MLLLQSLEQGEALLDLLKPGRRCLDVLRIAAQVFRQVFQLRLNPDTCVQIGLEGRVERCQFTDTSPYSAERREHRTVLLVQKAVTFLAESLYPLGTGEHELQRGEFFVLAGEWRRLVEFGKLEAREFDACIALGDRLPQACQFLRGRLPGGKRLRDISPRRFQAGEDVKCAQVRGRIEQRLVLVLAVEFDEPVGEILQCASGCEVTVDERTTAALRGNLAAHKPLFSANFEDGLDCRCVFACANKVARRASAQQQANGLDENGLTGPGLAAEDVQSGVELDLNGVDDRKASDREETKHRREENSNPNIGLTAIFTSCYSSARRQFGALPVALSQRRGVDMRRAVCARLVARSSPCYCRPKVVPRLAVPIRRFWA